MITMDDEVKEKLNEFLDQLLTAPDTPENRKFREKIIRQVKGIISAYEELIANSK